MFKLGQTADDISDLYATLSEKTFLQIELNYVFQMYLGSFF